MSRVIFGLFLTLHGAVHGLYAGQSLRFFELQPGMVWPDDSWVFSHLLVNQVMRWLAGIACLLVAIGFVVGGVGLILSQVWWRPMVIAAAVISSLVFLLFWDRRLRKMDSQGGIALLINLAILAIVLILDWPSLQ